MANLDPDVAGVAPPWVRVAFTAPPASRGDAGSQLATVTSLAGRLRARAVERDEPEVPAPRLPIAEPPPVPRIVAEGRDLPPRPTIRPEPGILGLSRRARGRFGSKVFRWFFVGVYTLIGVQLIWSLWTY